MVGGQIDDVRDEPLAVSWIARRNGYAEQGAVLECKRRCMAKLWEAIHFVGTVRVDTMIKGGRLRDRKKGEARKKVEGIMVPSSSLSSSSLPVSSLSLASSFFSWSLFSEMHLKITIRAAAHAVALAEETPNGRIRTAVMAAVSANLTTTQPTTVRQQSLPYFNLQECAETFRAHNTSAVDIARKDVVVRMILSITRKKTFQGLDHFLKNVLLLFFSSM